MQKYKAKVSSHELLAGSFQYLHLELLNPDRIDFKAGQYIILTIDDVSGIRRNYSIASQPTMDHAVELLVDIKPGGPGSEFLKNLQAGKEVEFIGPFGNFIVQDPCINNQRINALTHQLLFVATGSGISPIRAMILDLLIVKKYQGPIKLWWGMRNQEDCFWTEDFDDLEKDYPNFKWDLVLSNPPADWPLHSGHVTGHVLKYVQSQILNLKSQISTCFYLCGNKAMIDEVSTKLKETGINGEHVHTEKFF
jgi:NAD(P)H-flavin reductase